MDSDSQQAPDGFWENYVEAWKAMLAPYTPYPVMTADKLACLNWQHLLYVSFVALEAACNSELQGEGEVITALVCKEGTLSLEGTHEGQVSWVTTFGIENSALGCPAVSEGFAAKQAAALKYMFGSPDRKLLSVLETAVEDWLDEKLAPDWNIYLELAEMGELSEESMLLLEKIRRRLAVFRRKTIRSHLSNSKPSAGTVANGGAKASYIRNQTRRRRLASEPLPQKAAAAAVAPEEATAAHVEEGTEC